MSCCLCVFLLHSDLLFTYCARRHHVRLFYLCWHSSLCITDSCFSVLLLLLIT